MCIMTWVMIQLPPALYKKWVVLFFPGVFVCAKAVERDGRQETTPTQPGESLLRGTVGQKFLRFRGTRGRQIGNGIGT